MGMAEAFADWGSEARREEREPAPDRKIARLRSVTPAKGKDGELVLVVRIELTEEDVGA
jgi:hypothetical protein